jgi:transcription elongation factor GreB
MSRAFIKNDTSDDQIVIPRRAPLPPGVSNYVTPRGISLLTSELAELEAERSRVQHDGNDGTEQARQLAVLAQRIAAVCERIASARVVNPPDQPRGEVRFGATVTLLSLKGTTPGEERRFSIVGVDEANPATGLISFTSPIARAIMGHHVGETISLRTAHGEESLEIVKIE